MKNYNNYNYSFFDFIRNIMELFGIIQNERFVASSLEGLFISELNASLFI